jgi:hypothetical protein
MELGFSGAVLALLIKQERRAGRREGGATPSGFLCRNRWRRATSTWEREVLFTIFGSELGWAGFGLGPTLGQARWLRWKEKVEGEMGWPAGQFR